jgi:hypothetical protein
MQMETKLTRMQVLRIVMDVRASAPAGGALVLK